MNLYFDLEMTGLHQNTTPISLGVVAENGKTFYAEFTDYNKAQVTEWIRANVIKNLVLSVDYTYDGHNHTTCRGTKVEIKNYLLRWLRQFDYVEFIGDVLAYDWMLMVDLIATYDRGYPALPKNVYYIPFDLATTLKDNGFDPDVNREELADITNNSTKHNALWDAEVIKKNYEIVKYKLFKCVCCKEWKAFGSQLSYGSQYDGEWICGDCQRELIDREIKNE